MHLVVILKWQRHWPKYENGFTGQSVEAMLKTEFNVVGHIMPVKGQVPAVEQRWRFIMLDILLSVLLPLAKLFATALVDNWISKFGVSVELHSKVFGLIWPLHGSLDTLIAEHDLVDSAAKKAINFLKITYSTQLPLSNLKILSNNHINFSWDSTN